MPNTPDVGFGFGVEGDQSLLNTIKALREEMKNLKSQQDSLASSALNLSNAWGALVKLGATMAIAKLGRDAFEAAVSIGRMQQITGASAETLSVYRKAAEDVGVSHEALDKGVQKFAKSLMGLQQGSSQSAAGFALLHLRAKDFVGLNTDQALQKVTDRLGSMQDGMAKAAAAIALFGKSGAQLIPVFNQLAGTGFEAVATQAKRLGLVFNSDMAAAALRAAGSLHDLRGAAKPHDAHVHAPLHPANEWIQQEDRKPHRSRGALFHVLQFLPSASDVAGHASNGSGDCKSRVVSGRTRLAARQFKLTHYLFLPPFRIHLS